MNDLIAAISILGALGLFSLVAGFWLGKRSNSRLRRLLEVTATGLLAAYLGLFWNRPLLVDLIPASGLIILSNWLPLWGSFFVGIYATSRSVRFARRMAVSGLALFLSVYSGVAPLLGSAPECDVAEVETELLEQTTPYTCSPAAAATMLRLHGIDATEDEMADLCLTREGTHWMGLYRGLKLKTEGSEWDVEVKPFSLDALSANGGLPCVMAINIDTSGFERDLDHGFVDGRGHSVVYLHRNGPECVTVFDPSPDYGIEVWSREILSLVESGVIVRLVPADMAASEVAVIRQRTLMHATKTMTAGI